MNVVTHEIHQYAEELTNQTHRTIQYLYDHGHIKPELADELIGSLIVAPVRYRPSWPRRLLDRFFSSTSDENTWTFPIVSVAEYDLAKRPAAPSRHGKTGPGLQLVADSVGDQDK
jgi:hypothetical protein